MLTCAGRETIQPIASAMSCATKRLGDPGVDLVGPLLVATEPGQRELLGAHHAGRDLLDPHRLVHQLEPQRLGQRRDGVLGGDVARPALVGDPSGDRPDVEDGARARGDERRQQGLGDLERADHVGLEHAAPVRHVGVRGRRQPERAAGVVDQHVEAVAHLGGEAGDVLGRGHVADHGAAPDLGRDRLDPVGPPRSADRPRTHRPRADGRSPPRCRCWLRSPLRACSCRASCGSNCTGWSNCTGVDGDPRRLGLREQAAVRGIQGGAAVVFAALAAALPRHHHVLLADGGQAADLRGHGAEHHRSPGDAGGPAARAVQRGPHRLEVDVRGGQPGRGILPVAPGDPTGLQPQRVARLARGAAREAGGERVVREAFIALAGRRGGRERHRRGYAGRLQGGAGRRLRDGVLTVGDLEGAPTVRLPGGDLELTVERGRGAQPHGDRLVRPRPQERGAWPLTHPPLPDSGGPQKRDGTTKPMAQNLLGDRGRPEWAVMPRPDAAQTKDSDDPAQEFNLRSIAVPAYGPTIIAAIGSGAIVPIVALSALDLGASQSVAALTVGLGLIAELFFAVPAGALVHRVGERRALLWASAVDAVGAFVALTAPSLAVLMATVFAMGFTSSVFLVARQAYLIDAVPTSMRARALSTLGGVNRIGMFIGPFIGAPIIHFWGPRAGFAVAVAAGLGAAALVQFGPDLTAAHEAQAKVQEQDRAPVSTARVLWDHRRTYLTLGLGIMVIGAARSARVVLLPLWAEHVGLAASTTAIIFGIVGGVEMLLFYPAGSVMDRFGRIWVAVPCVVLLGVGHARAAADPLARSPSPPSRSSPRSATAWAPASS